MSLEITFNGLEADQHRLEADEGFESLAGLAHAATLVAHYVVTGKIRHRTPYDDRLRLYFKDTQPGSLTAILAIGGSLAMSVFGNALYDVLKAAYLRAIGQGDEQDLETEAGTYGSADLDALAEAISPSLLRGHSWIDHPTQGIKIKTGRKIISDFNQATKRYLKDEIYLPELYVTDVSVAALNVNSRSGRVFFFDLGRTVPFKVPRDAEGRTISNISRFLTKYAEKSPARVSIKYQKVTHLDGKVKRIIIYDCEEPIDEK